MSAEFVQWIFGGATRQDLIDLAEAQGVLTREEAQTLAAQRQCARCGHLAHGFTERGAPICTDCLSREYKAATRN